MKRIWLITWEWCGNHVNKKDKIVDIFHPNTSGEKMRQIVERLYVNTELNLTEKLKYLYSSKNTAYPAKFDTINKVPYQGKIFCGHNPYLYARLVENIKINTDKNGNEELIWDEIAKPQIGVVVGS